MDPNTTLNPGTPCGAWTDVTVNQLAWFFLKAFFAALLAGIPFAVGVFILAGMFGAFGSPR